MQTFTIQNKKVYNIPYCQSQLLANGYAGANLVCRYSTPPVTTVYVNDGTPNPTAFVTAYTDPGKIALSSNKPVGSSGFPECPADGATTQTITIKKVDPASGQVMPGSETVKALPNQFISVVPVQIQFSNGQAQIAIGPSSVPGVVAITVRDAAGVLSPATITLAFV
jgi:hypothetical protein